MQNEHCLICAGRGETSFLQQRLETIALKLFSKVDPGCIAAGLSGKGLSLGVIVISFREFRRHDELNRLGVTWREFSAEQVMPGVRGGRDRYNGPCGLPVVTGLSDRRLFAETESDSTSGSSRAIP